MTDANTRDVNENDDLEPVGLAGYRKVVTATVGAIVAIAAAFGTSISPEITNPIITLITAVLVWWIPNEQGTVEIEDHGRHRVGE